MGTTRLLASSGVVLLLAACTPAIVSQSGPAIVVSPRIRAEPAIAMPNREGSVKFAVFGDSGNGTPGQYELAAQMLKTHEAFPFELVLMAGDNLIGSERPQDYARKFETPYKLLLDAKVRFFAALGNHDDRNQRYYKQFNMEGQRYYSFKAPRQNVRFFALESTYPEPAQIAWIEKSLKESGDDWKVVLVHHPLYSSGGRHGSDVMLRKILEPLFIQHNVSVVFAGHDHFYERIKPQLGIVHFVLGSGGRLSVGDITARSPLTARGFDTDQAFLVGEVFEDQMHFNAVSRTGQIVDSGVIVRRQPPPSD
jgi:hypothetical protein